MSGRRVVMFDGEVERDILEMMREEGWDYDGEQANAYRRAMRRTLKRASCVHADNLESLMSTIIRALTRP